MGKEETTCYMGKEMEECCRSRVEDALKRRTSFIMLLLAVALFIIALTIKTADNNTFVNQVSFASTITSIVLSVIAIWMSISGERQTGEIKEKVVVASDKLAETVNESQKIMLDLQKTLDKQNDIYANLNDKITSVDTSLRTMNNSLFEGKVTTTSNTNDNNNNNEYFNKVMEGLKDWEYRDVLVKCMLEIFEKDNRKKIGDIIHETCEEKRIDENIENLIAGIICVFYHNKFFENPDNKEEVK